MAGPPSTPGTNPYRYVAGGGLSYAGVDQGIDFVGAGPIFAVGNGIVTRVLASGSGWPGQGAVLNYRIIDGPAKGRYVYVSEDFVPSVKPGDKISKGQTIGFATGSGQAPGIEVGWAQASGIPVAPRPAPRPANQYTPQGEDFRSFVAGGAGPPSTASALGGAAQHIPGVVQGEAVVSGVGSVAGFLGNLTNPSYILRGLQIMGGGFLVAMGLYLLIRQVGLAAGVDVPSPVAAATAALPVEREARYRARQPAPRRERIVTGPQPVYGKRRGSDSYGEVPF